MNPPKTFDNYQILVRNEFEKKKNDLYAGQLISPSTGTLKDLLLICYDKSLSQDKEIFNRFYGLKSDKEGHKQIEESSPDKLRSLRSFLMGITNSPSNYIVELTAILIDFNPRPYGKYLNEDPLEQSKNENQPEDIINTSENIPKETETQIIIQNKSNRRWTPLFIIIVLIIGILSFNVFIMDCNLMVWKNDHYEKVDCKTIEDDTLGKSYIKLNEYLLSNMKKIKVDSSTTFFNKDGTACIWYYKISDNELEYFTAPGIHPETGKTLKAITSYMIEGYVTNRKNDVGKRKP
ncbi:hypothetical protein [Flavobacterium sp. AG291]|uniref:hypothetical protein n=1 Tax=Flavobacterium sp. AG291 TaxID=2184000 RepID=UPI000E0BBE22|nr:hypothetical protein [Flavobacterium sp. AG291]RDI14441.1 hypothetical protein DEU42_102134 [Flavobacterium sp. AG291]